MSRSSNKMGRGVVVMFIGTEECWRMVDSEPGLHCLDDVH